ncbi:MAG TPA: hypothetical protein VGQ37_11885 [Vicinamibacterales bacterium]|jgi:hypothetical protein|nr:hypothetical protein [Vicinamibacterales bacterium]
MPLKSLVALSLAAALVAAPSHAQGIRDRIRSAPRATTVTESQASDLTLTLTQVEVRPVQTWVRTAGAIDAARKIVSVRLSPTEAALVKVGQRARTFPVESRSSMYQARVVRITPEAKGVRADVELAAVGWPTTKGYVVEIVTDHGELLSVPNEAIIEEGGTRVVYRQSADGQYEPTPVQTGVQGELYTQVTGGLKDGDQVVTFGSFFIDSEFKLKGAAQAQK